MQPNLCTCGLKFAPYSRTSARFPLQAESVHQGHERRLGRAEGTLYVHSSRPGRAEGALYVQPACLDVQRILRTVTLSRIFQSIDILVPQIWHHAPHPSNDQNMPINDVFSTTIITFSGWGSASGILSAAGCTWGQSSVPANLAMQRFCTDCVGK